MNDHTNAHMNNADNLQTLFNQWDNILSLEDPTPIINSLPMILLLSKARGAEADQIMSTFNFAHSAKVDAEGAAGGIYILWSYHVTVYLVALNQQEIYISIKVCPSNPPFILRAIYSRPYINYKHALWNRTFHASNNNPWLVLGDFNEITHPSE